MIKKEHKIIEGFEDDSIFQNFIWNVVLSNLKIEGWVIKFHFLSHGLQYCFLERVTKIIKE